MDITSQKKVKNAQEQPIESSPRCSLSQELTAKKNELIEHIKELEKKLLQ